MAVVAGDGRGDVPVTGTRSRLGTRRDRLSEPSRFGTMAGMRIDLAGRTALVTGSTQGIGRAIAAGLAAAGARVGINGRSSDSVDRALAELGDGDFVAVPADVSTADGAIAAVEALPGSTSWSTTSASSAPSPPWRSPTTTGGGTSR
ncbi:hypothetical protein GCM10029963_13550 [Micromonospora andamanensis]